MEEVKEHTVVLVDRDDKVIGSSAAAELGSGMLHRTASLYVYNKETDSLLLSKDSATNLWTASIIAVPLFGMTPIEVNLNPKTLDVAGAVTALQRATKDASQLTTTTTTATATTLETAEVEVDDAHALNAKFVGRMMHSTDASIDYIFVCSTTDADVDATVVVADTDNDTDTAGTKTTTTTTTTLEEELTNSTMTKTKKTQKWATLSELQTLCDNDDQHQPHQLDAKCRAAVQQLLLVVLLQPDTINSSNNDTATIHRAKPSSREQERIVDGVGNSSKKQGAYGKIVTHKDAIWKQLLHVDEVWAAVQFLYLKPLPSNLVVDNPDLLFCEEILQAVSRSFAAVIRQLPQTVLLDVAVFYLVLRALDTIEDDMTAFTTDTKIRLLLEFTTTALQDPDWRMDGVGEGDEKRLLQEFPAVHRVFAQLPGPSRIVIKDITHRMATGMAEFVHKDLGQGCVDITEYNRYCSFVAGLVGEGLSRLFAVSSLENASLAKEIHLSNQMGLFLQKTNIIRDFLEDYVDQRAFWPQTVWKKYSATGELGYFCNVEHDAAVKSAALQCLNELVTDALELVPDLLVYMSFLQCAEVFRFCAIPQVMAIATLEKCYNNMQVFTGVVKIRKGLSCKLILRSGSEQELHETFYHFAETMLSRCVAETDKEENPVLYARTVAACETVLDLTRLRATALRRARAVRQWSAVAAAMILCLWQYMPNADMLRAFMVVAVSILYWFGPWTVRSNNPLKTADLMKGM